MNGELIFIDILIRSIQIFAIIFSIYIIFNLVSKRDLNSAINIKNKFLGSERANVENNPSVQIEQGLSMKQEAITSTGVRL